MKSLRCTLGSAGVAGTRLLALLLLLTLDAGAAPGGYLTTPEELVAIAEKAAKGMEPHRENVDAVLAVAERSWEFSPRTHETCSGADDPAWNDNGGGTQILLAKTLAYHLTGEVAHARRAAEILEQIMTEVQTISLDVGQCRLNFGWGTPELVAAADLVEPIWKSRTCTGPTSTLNGENEIGTGPCKALFQNWLVKNPYYVVSLAGRHSMSNWGSAATNTMAHVADYLSDRPEVRLVHRNPKQVDGGRDAALSPAEAFEAANRLALDRMNGYGVEYGSSSSCDDLGGEQQSGEWPPVKSQITERGIIPEDARRDEFCNVPTYDGSYQNYPQIHLGNNIQQCELMRRRGDESCFQNVDHSDLPDYAFVDRKGVARTTHLRPGRGSIERAIKAIIVDSNTEWRRASALNVAYRYYFQNRRLNGLERWEQFLHRRPRDCSQDLCFGTLSHGFAPGEIEPAESPLPEPEPASKPLGKPGTPYPKLL
jgi:hypothetical protein